jgi:probable phosphoglycerate mutase
MRLILVRHGQSEGNAAGVVQGRVDFGLSLLGEEQARATGDRLASTKVDRVVSSPLLRAYQTANAVAAPHSLEVVRDHGLAEYDIGDASGLTSAEIRERYPHVMEAYRRGERPGFPGEEGRDAFQERVLQTVAHLRELPGTTVAVAHGGVISLLCSVAIGLDQRFRPGVFQVANCSITKITADRMGRLVIERHNDTCHLQGLTTRVDRG